MSKENPNDDPRQQTDWKSPKQTDKPWEGSPEKEQRSGTKKSDPYLWQEQTPIDGTKNRAASIIMRAILVIVAALVAALVCSVADAHQVHRARVVIAPLAINDPAWPVDYNIVPRYRYRPQDDRIDPYGKPVSPGQPEPGGFGIGQSRAKRPIGELHVGPTPVK